MLQLPLNIQLKNSAKFDNFFVGENTQLISKLTQLNQSRNEFIYIWGAKGVGKTHLAHACSQLISDAGKTAAYFPLDEPFISTEFLDNMESVDLVCLDGFDLVSKDKRWEHAVFNLYNQLKHFDRQLIIFAEYSPNQLEITLADLNSRLRGMEVYRLMGISNSDKTDYFIEYGQSRGLNISTEVANFVLTRTDRELMTIQDAVKNIDRQALTHKRKITIPFVKEILKI